MRINGHGTAMNKNKNAKWNFLGNEETISRRMKF